MEEDRINATSAWLLRPPGRATLSDSSSLTVRCASACVPSLPSPPLLPQSIRGLGREPCILSFAPPTRVSGGRDWVCLGHCSVLNRWPWASPLILGACILHRGVGPVNLAFQVQKSCK